MRKIIFIFIIIFGTMVSLFVFAHGIEEETKGKAISEKLEAKEANCGDLTDDDFEALGEYFMGQMTGTSHEAMNKMMEQMMGKEGEEEMHVVIGKRMSSCDPNAQMPENMMDMMSMMGGGGRGGMMNGRTWSMGNMMGNFGVWGWLDWTFMVLFWALVVLGIIALIKWIVKK